MSGEGILGRKTKTWVCCIDGVHGIELGVGVGKTCCGERTRDGFAAWVCDRGIKVVMLPRRRRFFQDVLSGEIVDMRLSQSCIIQTIDVNKTCYMPL